jgi:ribonuclease P protein component
MRVGLSVSKQVGSAVTRNQVKRRIRNAFVGMNIVDGWDIVVIAKPGSSSASYSELDGAILKLVQRLGIQFASTESPVETGAVV